MHSDKAQPGGPQEEMPDLPIDERTAEDLSDDDLMSAAMAEMFKDEALSGIDAVEAVLLEAEENEGAAENAELLHEAFRAMHSLKGNCGCIGLEDLERLAHRVEDLLDQIRTGQRPLDQSVTSVVLRALDAMREAVHQFPAGAGLVPGHAQLMDAISVVANAGAPASQPEPEPEPEPEPASEPVGAELSPSSSEAADPPPTAGPGSDGSDASDPEMPVEPARAPASMSAEPPPSESPTADTAASAFEPSVSSGPPKPPGPPSSSGPKSPPGGARNLEADAPRLIRVDVDKLDALINQVGELITTAATVIHSPDLENIELESFHAAANQLDRVATSLHDTAMAMRMVPLEGLFRKMNRVVRDLRQKLGKQIDLVIDGEATEVDKSLIESIGDPLVHIIRNAVDHGIESPEQRRAAGKDPKGQIELSARHQGSEVWIVVRDDGGGISPERLIEHAISKGLISSERAAMSDEEAYQLMFLPGFSTAKKVTNVSGRGVGMDVVRREVEAVRGRIDVHSTIGQGSEFIIRLPLTLAVIDAMILRVNNTMFALPLSSVRESLRISEQDVTCTPEGTRLLRLRDQMFPIVGLETAFRGGKVTAASEGILVLVEDGAQMTCLRVDELVGQQQIVIKALQGYLGNIRGVSGCSILGGGEICLILDVSQLQHLTRASGGRPSARVA